MRCLNYVLLNQSRRNRLLIKCLLKVYFLKGQSANLSMVNSYLSSCYYHFLTSKWHPKCYRKIEVQNYLKTEQIWMFNIKVIRLLKLRFN